MGLFSGEHIVNAVLDGTPSFSTFNDITTTGDLTVGGATVLGGVVDASNAAAGKVGQIISALVAVGSPVSLTTATAKTVSSVSLTAGDWDVSANLNFTAGSATVAAAGLFAAGISLTNNTLPTDGSEVPVAVPAITTTSFLAGTAVPRKRVSVSTTTTVYLVGEATFSAGSVGGYGSITARRVR